MSETVYNAADACELVEVLSQHRGVDRISMESGVSERNTVLIEVVANGNLAAEGIPAVVEVHLVVAVIASLHEYRHIQVSFLDGIDDADLETEVRK